MYKYREKAFVADKRLKRIFPPELIVTLKPLITCNATHL